MLDDLKVHLKYTHAGAGHIHPVPFEELSTRCADEYSRIVFLHRDPRDTAVSGYHQKTRRRDGYEGTMSDFIRDPLHGVEKILRYNRMWLDRAKTSPTIIVVSYEELQRDPHGTLRRILDFLGEPRDGNAIAAAIERNTFDKMKSRERSGAYSERYGDALTPANPDDPQSYKVRRGKVGGYHDELSPDDIAWCNDLVASLVRDAPLP